MREIKFRAWDEERKMMYYGDEIESRDDLIAALSYGQLVIFRVTDSEYTELNPLQYTELQDRNGKDIYEGDIIKTVALLNDHNQKGAINIVIVKNYMGNSCLCFNGYESGTPLYPLIVSHEIEIIGNIYDNPNLLEG